MAFKEYATEADFCKACSPYKVGDKVTLITDLPLEKGVLEKGSVLTITGVRLRENVTIPYEVYAEDVKCYEAPESCFEYALSFGDNNADGCYWYGSTFEKGALTKEELLDARIRKIKAERIMEKAKRKIFIPAYLGVFVLSAIAPSMLGLLITVSENLSGGDAVGLWFVMVLISFLISFFPCESLDEWAWGKTHTFKKIESGNKE